MMRACSVFNSAPGRRRTSSSASCVSDRCGAGRIRASGRRGDRGQATDSSGFERVVLTAGRSTVHQHAVRHHADRGDEPRCRRRRCRSAARSADRRQERRNGEPDRVGRRPAPAVRRRRRSGRDDASADVPEALSRRGHPRRDERRERHPLRAACRATPSCCAPARSPTACRARPTSSTCCSFPAARRASRSCCRCGSPRSIASAIKELGVNLFATRPEWSGRSTTQQFAAPDSTTTRRRAGLQRFSQPVLLQPQGRPRRGHQGARAEGPLSDARRAEPDRLQRPGGELPRRR